MTATTQIAYKDNSASTMARERFQRTGQRMSPYLARPDRETFESFTVFLRGDGSIYMEIKQHSRWGSVWADPRLVKTVEEPSMDCCAHLLTTRVYAEQRRAQSCWSQISAWNTLIASIGFPSII